MGEKKNANRLLVGKPEGKRPFGNQDGDGWIILRLIFGEIGWCVVDWIGLCQDKDKWKALVNTAMNIMIP
jgi:hypothetical protein